MPGRGVPGKGDNLSPEGSGLCGHLHRQGASGSSVPWEISQFLSDTAPLKAPGPEDPDPDTSVGPRLGRHKGGGCLTSSKNLAPRGISIGLRSDWSTQCVSGQPELHSETLFQKHQKLKENKNPHKGFAAGTPIRRPRPPGCQLS